MPRVHLTVPLRGKACSCATGIASWWCGQCTTCRCLYVWSKLVQWQKPLDRKEVLTFTNKQFLYIFYTQIRDFLFGLWSPGFFWRHDGWDGFAFHPSAPWWATKPWEPTKITKMVPCLDMEQLERGLLVYSRCELENLREWVCFWKPKAVEAKGRKVLLRKKQLWLCTCVNLRNSFYGSQEKGSNQVMRGIQVARTCAETADTWTSLKSERQLKPVDSPPARCHNWVLDFERLFTQYFIQVQIHEGAF